MYTNIEQLKCGTCEHTTTEVYQQRDEYGAVKMILLKCTNCNDITEIKLSEPRITLEIGENSSGCMAYY